MQGVSDINESLAAVGVSIKPFDDRLSEAELYPLLATGVTTLQVNVGRVCNLACKHCHVEAGPKRTESMSAEVADECIRVVSENRIGTVDITGGAPEMNPNYRRLVAGAVEAGARVITRTNLVVVLEDGCQDLPEFWAENQVEVVASLPHYTAETTDRMRGSGAFEHSIEAIKKLNEVGYGTDGTGHVLSIAYNPCGAFMPGSQASVEADFKRALKRNFGVSFSTLYTITNMPVGRFLDFLKRSGNLANYLDRLASAYNSDAAENAMCRSLVSVGYDGSLFDCDFNQMLGLKCGFGAPGHIVDFDMERMSARRIVTGPHCYGCTAGAGSSCTGEVA